MCMDGGNKSSDKSSFYKYSSYSKPVEESCVIKDIFSIITKPPKLH